MLLEDLRFFWPERYLEPSQISVRRFFAKIVNEVYPLAIFVINVCHS